MVHKIELDCVDMSCFVCRENVGKLRKTELCSLFFVVVIWDVPGNKNHSKSQL
jgi:hypothetical protein